MRTFSLVALALSTALAAPSPAQTPGYSIQPQTSADQLAAVMRRLAAAPTDMLALIQAGELSVKLDDMSAAAAFFARADRIDGRNGRVKAGMASILVRAERPGEALRYFQMAEAFGLPPSRFAADRGLALDLLGEQERAQRDYRLALRTGPADDETLRRYALSLGISGKRSLALDQLEPLIRRQDRPAWRVRAFVLAMDGDVAGANKIAAAVMPAGMAAGLRPFFDRLPALPPADRAFAVHFGEVRPTPARLADARMKPFLPALGPDPYAPVVRVASAQASPAAALAAVRGRSRDRRAERRERVQLASSRIRNIASAPVSGAVAQPPRGRTATFRSAPSTQPMQVAARPPLRTASAPVQVAGRPFTPPARTAPIPVVSAPVQPTVPPFAALQTSAPVPSRPVQVAGLAPPAPSPAASGPEASPAVPAAFSPVAPAPLSATAPRPVQVASAVPAAAAAMPGLGTAASSAGAAPAGLGAAIAPVPIQPTPQPGGSAVASSPAAASAIAPGVIAPAPTSAERTLAAAAPGFTAPPPAAAPAALGPASPVTAVSSEDSILARIVASIIVPGAELGVAEPARRPAPAVAAIDPATQRTLAAGRARVARESADRDVAARTIAAAAKAGARRGAAEATGGADRKLARVGRVPAAVASRGARGKAAANVGEDEVEPTPRARGGKVELASKGAVRGRAAERKADEPEPRTRAGKRAADRKSAAEAAAAKKEPAAAGRFWVQVAGGAEERALSKAWTTAQRRAAALKGRDAYSTPARATNRVVTGPFKTEAEARALVNQLAKQGVSAFQFTSAAGQKMTKLPAK